MSAAGFGILVKRVSVRNETIIMRGVCALKLPRGKRDLNRLSVRIRGAESHPVDARFSGGKGIPFISGYRLHPFRMQIRIEDALQMDIQNKLDLHYGEEWLCGVSYSLLERRTGAYKNTAPIRAGDKVMYFRQTGKNTMWFCVRPANLYDAPLQRYRVFAARVLAGILGASGTILMYEKECSRYEESASVLFEKLVDMGYDNVYYVIDPSSPQILHLQERYRKQMIPKDSFRHILEFFRCRTFIGTETIDHALQLRAANRWIQAQAQNRDLTHIFLQHGVMYMVSLDADLRIGFVSRKVKKYRVVVSSEAEAMHFMLLGGFRREEIYVTGLAKFDRSIRQEDSDLIMIMPTWRRWETNLAQQDFEKTGYYRMLQRMVEAVPEELRDKIVIKPHPLMQSLMERGNTGLECYLRPEMSHDDVLKRCRLLITDYSSIAYDAFYRGANVIFCWEEKEECMRHYGGAHLMINDYNVFGDVCYSQRDLQRCFSKNYEGGQNPVYVRRYGNIVSYRDGRNTERIIECLKKDHVI